jgi:predicted DNA-binding transcriptional regulator YafY
VRFPYVTKDDRAAERRAEPAAVVHSGYRWYLLAFDLDRDDWRTFRVDRIKGRVREDGRGRRRSVPGGDPAAYVRNQLRSQGVDEGAAVPGRVRLAVPAAQAAARIPSRYVAVEPDGEDACVVTTRGQWSRSFLVWMATLDLPMQVLGPPEMVAAARTVVERLSAA